MKKLLTLMLCSMFLFTSCGTDGPPGPPGPPGEDGFDGFGTVIDFENVDFTEANNYEFVMAFNEYDIDVFESDAVLVYLKVGEDGTADGLPVEVFRPLPQTYYVNGEAVQYNFEFTFFNVWVFMDGTADLGLLDPAYTDDQILRIIVVPAEFAETINTSNMDAVLKSLDIQETDIKKASF